MSSQSATRHEKSSEHRRRVQNLATWNLEPDVEAWVHGEDHCDLYDWRVLEKMRHVDSLKELVPFWQQQVAAANRGVELRFEDFLETMEQENIDAPTWDVQAPDWALDVAEEDRSSVTAHAEQSDVGHGGNVRHVTPLASDSNSDIVDRDAFMFVEKVARLNSTSDEGKRRMHAFYKIPTDEKVARIQEIIDILKKTS